MKYILKINISLLIFLTTSHLLVAQHSHNLRFDRFASEEFKITKGLSQNSVNCIMQDSYGFMWFGTWDGLNRFDGKNFVTYKPQRSESGESISNQTVNDMAEDEGGVIWLATDKGLFRFDRKTQEFQNLKNIPGQENSLTCDTVNAVMTDGGQNLWLGTNRGLNRYDINTGKFKRYYIAEEGKRDASVNYLCRDKSGRIWLGTRKGLAYVDPGFEYAKMFGTKNDSLNSIRIRSMYIDREGYLWVGTTIGLYKLDPLTGREIMFKTFETDETSDKFSFRITAIYEGNDGMFWIGTSGNGLYIMDRSGRKVKRYVYDPGDDHSLSNDYITCIFGDLQGNVWVGTTLKGVNRFNPFSYNFLHYKQSAIIPNTLNNNNVWSFMEMPNGKIWIATDGGVNIFDPITDKFEYLKSEEGDPNTIIRNRVRSFCSDKKGNIWIGYLFSGLSCYNPFTGKIKHYNTESSGSISRISVWDMVADKSGKIWVGTFNGLKILDPETGSFELHSGINPGSELAYCSVYSINEDHKGNYWIGTNKGLFYYNSGKFIKHNKSSGCTDCLSASEIFGTYEDKNGILWIGTMGNGLVRYDPASGKAFKYTESEGLANNVVYDILPDKENHLWVSTNHGVSRFDPASGLFTNYDVSDGLQGFEYNVGSSLITKRGELLFGGVNGFNMLKSVELPEKKYVPPTVVTGFKIFNETNYHVYTDGDTIELNHTDNFFTFLFAMLDFSDASRIQYEFLLENIDKRWHRTDAQKMYAEYTNIEPGNYKFRLRSIVPNPGIRTKEICINLFIKPPWYATWLFRIIAIAIISFTTFIIIYSRVQRMRRKHAMEFAMLDMEKRLFDTERMALRLQMNPHFIFNTLNAIQYFIFQNDKLSANRYISMFSKLMRQILVNSQYNTILLKDDLDALELYVELELLRFTDKFDYRIIVRPDESILQKYIPSMILQPYVENAIRHGLIYREEKGLLKIEISDGGNGTVVCVIEDNGVGRKRAEEIRQRTKPEHVSMGTKITESRLNLMSNLYKSEMKVQVTDLSNSNGDATGTRVELIIPTFEK